MPGRCIDIFVHDPRLHGTDLMSLMTALSPRPLAGIRIVEFDAIGPVPLASMILADLGCDIVRITRRADAAKVWDDVGGAVLNRNRRCVALDLKDPADCDRALDLIALSDAMIEGFRPGVMERLGLGPDVCLARNPRLAFVRMTGWGQTGPLSKRAGHDINYIALSGALHAMGEAGRPPVPPLNLVGDYGGGAMFAVTGLLAAVVQARATGSGQAVDVSMVEGTAVMTSIFHAFMANGGWSDARASNLIDGSAPFYRCYACADGGHVAVGALEPQFFALLMDGLGIERERFKQYDKSVWPEMTATFQAAFGARSRDQWAAVFQESDACVTPVLTFSEVADHPHNAARQTFASPNGVRQPMPAPRFSASVGEVANPVPGSLEIDDALKAWGRPSA